MYSYVLHAQKAIAYLLAFVIDDGTRRIGYQTAVEKQYKRRPYCEGVNDQHIRICIRKSSFYIHHTQIGLSSLLTTEQIILNPVANEAISELQTMVIGFPARAKKSTSLRSVFLVALVCFVVFFPTKSSAQRAAVGIGSKLKGRFGMGSGRASRSGKLDAISEGEQENDNSDRHGMLLIALWTIMTEKTGIALGVLAFLCGYIYLFLQQSKIDEIEQALAAGEFRILAYLLVAKRKLKERDTRIYIF